MPPSTMREKTAFAIIIGIACVGLIVFLHRMLAWQNDNISTLIILYMLIPGCWLGAVIHICRGMAESDAWLADRSLKLQKRVYPLDFAPDVYYYVIWKKWGYMILLDDVEDPTIKGELIAVARSSKAFHNHLIVSYRERYYLARYISCPFPH